MEEIINELKEIQKMFLALAQTTRTKDQKESYANFKRAEACRKAANELQKQIPMTTEIEGGGETWWYVCPECHGSIDHWDHYCKHCGQAVRN